jgi:TatD DNase family protein
MVDSHCHLADAAFAPDLDAVVQRARDAGVGRVLCILAAGDVSEQGQAARLQSIWPEVRFATGVHPHQAGEFAGDAAGAVAAVRRALGENPAVRAIGEIGLDYHYDFAPRDAQRDVFRRQVRLAAEVALPVVIHSREAEREALQIIQEEGGGSVGGVFHCFTGEAEVAAAILEAGLHLSFAGIVTFNRAEVLREVARGVPADRLLTETDAPFLAPVPHRGRRNEPAWIVHVTERLAQIRETPLDVFRGQVARAFDRLFGDSAPQTGASQ